MDLRVCDSWVECLLLVELVEGGADDVVFGPFYGRGPDYGLSPGDGGKFRGPGGFGGREFVGLEVSEEAFWVGEGGGFEVVEGLDVSGGLGALELEKGDGGAEGDGVRVRTQGERVFLLLFLLGG